MEHILVTGGTGNLGKIVVGRLLDSGYELHLAIRGLEDALANGNLQHYVTELTSQQDSQLFVEKIVGKTENIFAGIFIAGGFMAGTLHDTSMDDINNMVEMNFATAFNSAVHLIKHFRKTGGGKLIFIGAKAAYDNNTAINNMAYSISKQMLFNFTAMINECEAGFNTTAHILLPGTLDTAFNRSQMPDANFSEWTSTEGIADTILQILQAEETRNIIHL